MTLEVSASPEPSDKSPASIHLGLGLGIDTSSRAQSNPLGLAELQSCKKKDFVYTIKFVIIGYALIENDSWALESDKYGFASKNCHLLSV